MPKGKPTQRKEYAFGQTFTDHMLQIDWSREDGWEKPQIVPYGPMSIPISATVLHYGVSCYEGLNIVKNRETGNFQSFRADEHLLQFLDSSNHLDMPLFDT